MSKYLEVLTPQNSPLIFIDQSRSGSAAGILAAPCHEPCPTQHLNGKP